MADIKRVGITGANGTIGTVLRQHLGDDYELKSFTLEAVDFPSTVADLARAEQVEGLFEGLDAVVHLAADPSPDAGWESVRDNNIEATYLVCEECVRAGVRWLVFATTNHTQHGNTLRTTPETLDPAKRVHMRLDDMLNPDSLYAVSKLFGENLGKYYSERHGLEFVGLRIGWIVKEDDATVMRGTRAEDYLRAMFLSHRDCAQAVRRAFLLFG